MLCKDGALFFHVSFGKLFLSGVGPLSMVWGICLPFRRGKDLERLCSNRLQIDDFIFILKKKDIMLL